MSNESLNFEIWDRLLNGKSLDGLGLDTFDGRTDVRALELPEPEVRRRFRFRNVDVAAVDSFMVHEAKWRNLDFSNSKLAGLRLMRGLIENCLFDGGNLQGARIWATSFHGVSFKGANLRDAVLGGVQQGVRNSFLDVDFSGANLSESSYQAAAFEGCRFDHAKLVKIDFQSSTFKNCRFEGELRDVLFYRHGFKGEQYPPNEMVNIDFTHAKLRDVGFRNLALDQVRFPRDSEHLVIRNFTDAMDRAIETLSRTGDTLAQQLVAFIRIYRKWSVPKQAQGVINLKDLAEILGDEGVKRFLAAIPQNSKWAEP